MGTEDMGIPVASEGEVAALIRPVRLDDAEALWQVARQAGVIETTLALPSLRLDQRRQSLKQLGPDEHCFVAEVDGAAGAAQRTTNCATTSARVGRWARWCR
jgi:hypothetical protein